MTGFPFTEAMPIRFASDLPARTEVVVIGGGVIGVCTALFLARQGVPVVLLEKGRIAAEQSSRNWGWVRVQGRDAAEIPILLEAREHWQAFEQQIEGGVGLTTCGVLYLADKAGHIAGYEGWLAEAAPFDLDSHILSKAQLTELLPAAQPLWHGALYTPSDMRAEPWVAVPRIADLAREAGARIVEGCAVRTLETTGGAVSSVVTEKGEIKTSSVVLAGGAWSRLFLRRMGLDIPQLSVRSSAMATAEMPEFTSISGGDSTFSFRRRADGGYTITPAGFSELFVGPDAFRSLRDYLPLLRQGGFDYKLRAAAPAGYPDAWGTPRRWSADAQSPFERMRILNPTPNAGALARLLYRFRQAFPGVDTPVPKATWAGMIDAMPDVVPVVDRVDALPGLTVSTGMCGHGFGIGPAFGRITAALVQGDDTGHDLSRFRFDRFRDGTPFQPGPTI